MDEDDWSGLVDMLETTDETMERSTTKQISMKVKQSVSVKAGSHSFQVEHLTREFCPPLN